MGVVECRGWERKKSMGGVGRTGSQRRKEERKQERKRKEKEKDKRRKRKLKGKNEK